MAALVILWVVALGDSDDTTNAASRSTVPPTPDHALPTVATTFPSTSTASPTTIPTVKVPEMVGMRLAKAKDALADQG